MSRGILRKPSIKKSLAAKYKGAYTRKLKKSLIPGYGTKTAGWLHPKRKLYNKIYYRTSIDTRKVIADALTKKNERNTSSTSSNVSQGKKVTNYNEYHLNDDVSYYRRYTTYQLVTAGITILLIFWNPLIALVFWIVTWCLEQKVKVSPIDGSVWFIVPKKEWIEYRKSHNVPLYKQYYKNHIAKFDTDVTNQNKVKALEQHDQELQAEYQKTAAPFKNDGALKVGRYYFDPSREEILMDTTLLDKHYKVYKFSDIVSYTPIEEGHNQTKKHGITRAVVGGAIAGGAGAIVGAVTGGKNYDYVDKLGVVITFSNNDNIRLMFLNSETKKGGFVANEYYKQFHDVCGVLDATISKNTQRLQLEQQKKLTNQSQKSISAADEIVKYKKLADDGVITQEEFEAKKKQMLNI